MGVDERFDPEETVNLQWCIDNETGEKVLVDKINNKIVGKWSKNKICPLCGRG